MLDGSQEMALHAGKVALPEVLDADPCLVGRDVEGSPSPRRSDVAAHAESAATRSVLLDGVELSLLHGALRLRLRAAYSADEEAGLGAEGAGLAYLADGGVGGGGGGRRLGGGAPRLGGLAERPEDELNGRINPWRDRDKEDFSMLNYIP